MTLREEDDARPRSPPAGCPTATPPIPTASTSLLLADGPDGLRPPGPHAQPRPPGGGEGGAAVHARRRRPQPRRPRVGAHRLPQGGGAARRCVADGPAAARRELQRLVEAFGRDRVLVELWDHGDPLDSARNDALAELAARHDVGCVATTNAHYATPAQRRLATALAAVRARRSLAELDPWLPAAAGAHLRSGAEQAPPLRPLSRRRRAGRRDRPGGGVRPVARRPVAAAVPVPRRADRDGSTSAGSSRRAAAAATASARRRTRTLAAGPGVADDRPRAGDHRAARLRRLLPRRVGPRRVLPASGHLLPGPGERRQLGGLLRPRRHRRRRRVARPAVRALPVARARRAAGHRHRHRERPPGGGHPVRLRQARPPPHGAGRQRHHLPGHVGGARHGQGARPRPRPAGRLVQARRRLGQRSRRRRSQPEHGDPAAGARARRCRSRTRRGTSASTPAGW